MHGYTSPILSIPPEQYAQYLQQYQHQRMLQHLHQQQQYQQQIQHATRHPQHAQRADPAQVSSAAATSIHPSAHPSVNLSQYHAQQQQQQRWHGTMPSSSGSTDPPGKPASASFAHAQSGSSDSLLQSTTTPSAVDTQPSMPVAPDAAAPAIHDGADNDVSVDSFDGADKVLDERLPPPPPKLAFTGPQSAPSTSLGSPRGQAGDPSDPSLHGSSAPHSASYPPHAAAMHDHPPSASRMPPAVAMPAADAITATQGGQIHASSSDGAAPEGSPPGQGGSVMGQPVLPPMMMPSMGYPPGHQAYGMPLPLPAGSGWEVYPYGCMMVPMMPGMMLPPPPQQQIRAGRGGRGSAPSANAAGWSVRPTAILCTTLLLLMLVLSSR